MKNLKQIILISVLCIMSASAWSQDIKLSMYSTPSSGRKEIGTAVGILLPGAIGDIEVGAFYERNGYLNGEDSDAKNVVSKDYTGLYTTMYLVGNEKLSFGANIRGGYFDSEKFIITFAALAEYYVNPNVALGASVRFIDELPKIEGRMSFNLAGSRNRKSRHAKYAETWEIQRSYKQERKGTS